MGISRKTVAGIVVGIVLSVAAGVAGFQRAVHVQISPPPSRSTWVHYYASVGAVKEAATDIVLARVARVEAGPDIVQQVPGEPDGEVRIPTQRITLDVKERFKGEGSNQLVLFKTGSSNWYIEGDPHYQVGETEVLFLRPQRDTNEGTYLVVSPQGRYKVKRNRLVPVDEGGGLPDELRGKTLAEFAQLLRGN